MVPQELGKYPVTTRLSLAGTMIVARDIAHAKILERLEAGQGLPQYIKDHPVYYAGPAKVTTCESAPVRPGFLLLTFFLVDWIGVCRRRRATRPAPSDPRPRGAWTPTSTAFRCQRSPLGGIQCAVLSCSPTSQPDFPPRFSTPLALTRRRAGLSSCSPRATAPRCRQALRHPPSLPRPAPPRPALPRPAPLNAMNTTLPQAVTAACKKHGGFYLGSIGGPAAILAKDCIKKVEVLEYPELGMEAVWRIEVEDFPAFVVVDDKGTNGALCSARVVEPPPLTPVPPPPSPPPG